jgi:hypothetical protein
MMNIAGVGAIAELSVVLFFFTAVCHSPYQRMRIDALQARKLSQQGYEANERHGVNRRNE